MIFYECLFLSTSAFYRNVIVQIHLFYLYYINYPLYESSYFD